MKGIKNFQISVFSLGLWTQLQCLDVDLEIVILKMTVKYLEKEKPVFQHEEVPGIHRTLVEIKSPDLYLWGVHKELQEPDLVRALNLSI
nr:hypothetical protein [Tanacetum cinerariifolium]